jgi:hypothetical protein
LRDAVFRHRHLSCVRINAANEREHFWERRNADAHRASPANGSAIEEARRSGIFDQSSGAASSEVTSTALGFRLARQEGYARVVEQADTRV